jgi:hypothetical protein
MTAGPWGSLNVNGRLLDLRPQFACDEGVRAI